MSMKYLTKIKTLVLATILCIAAPTIYTGCVTSSTGQKELSPVAFETLKQALFIGSSAYTSSKDGAKYEAEFRQVILGIDTFLIANPTQENMIAFSESFGVNETNSHYLKYAVSLVAVIYQESVQQKIEENIPNYDVAKTLLIAIRDGFESGLETNQYLQ